MNLNTSFVGTPLKNYQTKINWRETTNYAAAVQDNNPKYFDDRKDKKIVSHPMFAVSVTWPVVSRLEKFIESRDFPKQVLMTQVHYTEHLILHRLIRPGDELSITGTLKAFLPHRAGTHAIICLEAKDRDGDPERPYIYDGCTNIEFPIHTSPNFAKMVGLPGIILQGTATLAYAGAAVDTAFLKKLSTMASKFGTGIGMMENAGFATFTPADKDVMEHCKSMASYKRPQHIEIWPCIRELPLTRSTKVDKLKSVELAGPIVQNLRNMGKWDANPEG